MIPFDYIPQTIHNPNRTDVVYLLRKRIFHSGWQLSYCDLSAHEDIWVHLAYPRSEYAAMNIIMNSHH